MSSLTRINQSSGVSTLCFSVYIYFVIDYFLRFSARIPAYGTIRPTLLAVALISILLLSEKVSFKDSFQDRLFKIIILLILYIFISLPLVEWPGSVLKNNLSPFIKAVVFFIFTCLIVRSEKRLKILVSVYVATQIFRVLEPLFLNVTQGYWGDKTYVGSGGFANRLAGAPADVINPNELGFVIVTVLPYLHYMLWNSRLLSKLLYLLLLPCLLYALILTMSRGAFIALLVVLWLIFKDSKRKFVFILVLFVIAIFSWSSMNDYQRERYLSIFGGESAQAATAEGRFRGIRAEFMLGFNKPFFGHGLGTTPEAKTHVWGQSQASHNLYAELMIEIGIFGSIIYLFYLKNIHNKLVSNSKLLIKSDLSKNDFLLRLNKSFIAVFWMYVVYSINYWGLSQYYWYLFGGMTVVFSSIITTKSIKSI